MICTTVTVASNAPTQYNVNVTVTSQGYYGNGFQSTQGNSPTSPSATVQVRGVALTVSQSPSTLNLSTGDTNRTITTNVNAPGYPFTPSFAWGLEQNPNSSCAANLDFSSNAGAGQATTTVTAGPAGCSGIFNAVAVVNGVVSSNQTQVVVPPQILIQMLYGEAHGQAAIGDQTSQLAIGEVVRTGFSQSAYFSNVQTYQAAITSSQFDGIATNVTNGPEDELRNASAVFTGSSGVSVSGSGCFFSPTAAGWAAIQAALQNPALGLPTVTYDPGLLPKQPSIRCQTKCRSERKW